MAILYNEGDVTPPPHFSWIDRPYLKSRLLLGEWLTPEQQKQFDETRTFGVVGSHGGLYSVRMDTRPRLVRKKKRWFGGYRYIRYCVTLSEYCPIFDHLLAIKVMLELDEHAVLRTANKLS